VELLPPQIRRLLCERYPIGSQDGQGDAAKVVVKPFFPAGGYTLYFPNQLVTCCQKTSAHKTQGLPRRTMLRQHPTEFPE
jgi:hypothetical protein